MTDSRERTHAPMKATLHLVLVLSLVRAVSLNVTIHQSTLPQESGMSNALTNRRYRYPSSIVLSTTTIAVLATLAV
jgi:hypothetical protein